MRQNSLLAFADKTNQGGSIFMKRTLSILLAVILLFSVFAGCAKQEQPSGNENSAVSDSTVNVGTDPEQEADVPNVYADGRARPSNCGALQVINGKLCSEKGEPVILRGVSSYGLVTAESFLNDQLFSELAQDTGVNVFRLAMYTYGVGIVGYCTDGDKVRHKEAIHKGVETAKKHDMYALIDWHILSDGDPNIYIEDAKEFFGEMAEKYCDYNNVIYEICNEPNGVDWAPVKKYAETIIPIIREKDPNAVIIVGNPDWSKDLNAVMADPLDFDNIMYTFHFYAASHKDDWRNIVENASKNNLPIFVTEYGISASSGGFPIDIEEADKWIDLLEREKISHCMWSYSKVGEASSAIRFSVPKYNGFTEDDYSETGKWLINMIKTRGENDNY